MADQTTWKSTPIFITGNPTLKDPAQVAVDTSSKTPTSESSDTWKSQPIFISKDEDRFKNVKLKPAKGDFENYVAPIIRTMMVDGGVAAGAGLSLASTPLTGPGGPVLAAGAGVLGGVGGDQLYQQVLQRFLPQYFGEMSPDIPESLRQSGEQGALNTAYGVGTKVIGAGINKVAPIVKKKLLNNFFPINPTPDVQAALLAPEGQALQPTVAQYTQSELGQFAEDNLKGQAKRELFARQQPILETQAKDLVSDVSKGQFSGIKTSELNPTTIGKSGKEDAKTLFDAAKNSEKARWKNLLEVEVPKVKDTTTNGINVEGPIYANKTQDFARGVSAQLDAAIAKESNPETLAYLQKLKAKVDPYTVLSSSGTNGEPVLNYVQAKDDKDLFYRLTRNKDVPPEIKREIGLVGSLGDLLGTDIKDSIDNYWPASAQKAYDKATAKTKSIAKAFYGVNDTGILDPATNAESAINSALQTPQAARTFRMQTGGRTQLGTEYVRNILDKAQDSNGYFDGNKAIKMFSDSGDIAKEALSSDQRSAFTNLMKRMQGVDPKLVERGSVALAFRYGSAVFGIAGGILTGLKSGSISEGATTGAAILGTIQLSKHAIENVMLNPNTARMMANLSHLPPQSTQAQSITKYLFKTALKGETISILDPTTGETQNRTIGDEGKLLTK